MTALDRLNALLLRTEQFASFSKPSSSSSSSSTPSAPRDKSKRSHADSVEKEEDAALIEDELEDDSSPTHASYTRLLEQPASVKGEMREYQLEALNWLIRLHEQRISGILADEMGLGKTLESLSLLSYLKAYRAYAGPHLIIVPKSTSSNWMREIARWTPNLTAMKFHGTQDEREVQKRALGSTDVVVTTYEMVIREKSALRKIHWRYLFIDEAHRIKNENSLLAIVVRTLPSEHRLLITGTPLQNSLREVHAIALTRIPTALPHIRSRDHHPSLSLLLAHAAWLCLRCALCVLSCSVVGAAELPRAVHVRPSERLRAVVRPDGLGC